MRRSAKQILAQGTLPVSTNRELSLQLTKDAAHETLEALSLEPELRQEGQEARRGDHHQEHKVVHPPLCQEPIVSANGICVRRLL